MNSPVLFLVFNRPETTSRVFEAIRSAKPKRLYIAADGPRNNIPNEHEKTKKVRSIATKVDWDCKVTTLFRNDNLGCKLAVSSAITWFFKFEDEGIILEDDCLPDQSFFPYCDELLAKYRSDTRIMLISGDNFQKGNVRSPHSYYFSHYTHIWGWATWKRAWRHYDDKLESWPKIKESKMLDFMDTGNEGFKNYWSKKFQRCYEGEIDSWAYPWMFSCWTQSGLTIIPNINLVENIGFGDAATHTKKSDNLPTEKANSIRFPLDHPDSLFRHCEADTFSDRHHFSINWPQQKKLNKLYRRIKRIISLFAGRIYKIFS